MVLDLNMLRIKRTARSGQRKIETAILDFKGGVNKLLSESRIALNEAKESVNLMQEEDGLWRTRWGSSYYGADHGAVIDGASEYVKSDGTTELIVIAGGKAYKSTNGGTKTEVTGATFTAGTQCYFLQIGSYLYIANGTDALARYDGTSLTAYASLSAPAGLAGARTGIASGTYSVYCEVTALNDVGETIGSSEVSLTVNKTRDTWDSASDYITWTCSAVASATSYQWYISETSGQEGLVASTETTTFKDDGTRVINTYVTTPLGNTTAGPKFKSMCLSGNRIWATNDVCSTSTVYFSGTGINMGKFSDFYGGGWINLEKGGRELPIAVKHYQSGGGDGRATVLCKTPEGQGAIWQLQISTITIGDTSFSVPSAVKVVGSSGTESILGVVATNNDILFPNKRGVYSLGPEKNYYGILRTNEISVRIRPYWLGLVGTAIDNICAYFKDAKVFFSVPTSGTTNNRTIIYDLERLNWTVDWTIGARQFLEYTDTSENVHFLYVPYSGYKLIELSSTIRGDLGSAFITSYYSGRWPVAKLFKDYAKINKIHVKLNAPTGKINFEVLGTQKNESFKAVSSKELDMGSSSSNTGLGFDRLGTVQLGDTNGSLSTIADSAIQRFMKIRKKLRDLQFRVSTTQYDSSYTLLGFIIEGNTLKINPPTSEKLT